MDETSNPLEDRPFRHELGGALRYAVEQARRETPPAHSLARSLERARRLGPGRTNPWLRYHRAATAAAVAAVLFLAFGLLLICWHYQPASNPPNRALSGRYPTSLNYDDRGEDIAVFVDHGGRQGQPDGLAAPANTEEPFLDAAQYPTAMFPLTVDATAYPEVRRALLVEKRLPRPDAVRVAGLINAFTYSYPEPANGQAVSLTLDLAECPWNAEHYLARIGVRGGRNAAVTEAEVLVAFNARQVSAYRLIGYEGRRPRDSAAVGETLGAGQAATALYEIVPANKPASGEWLTVKMRYQGGQSRLSRSLIGPAQKMTEAPTDFRFAAAAAEFGLLLRESEYRGDATYDAVRIAARASLGTDADGRRAELLAMVDAAERLHSARKLLHKEATVSFHKPTKPNPRAVSLS